jgi:SAM-dependent methyltransferase
VGGSPSSPAYDVIGEGYARTRQADPRIAALIHGHLGAASTVVNVGAGAGSYEPTDRRVVAVEPSGAMIRQRPAAAAPALRASAEALPFAAATFAAGTALLTVHHWPDPLAGLAELRRVTIGPIVVFTFDHSVHAAQWLVTDYLPSMVELDTTMPSPAEIAEALGGGVVEVLPVPHDCTDGFCHAWWRRPDAYLDPAVRAGISGIARLPAAVVDEAMARLAGDIDSGRWHAAHADLSLLDEIDAGYRLVVAGRADDRR